MSEGENARDTRAVVRAKVIRGVTRNKHKSKDRHADRDRRRDVEDADEMGVKIIKPWERR